MTRIAIPALVVMMAVAAYVGAAGWNASGEPRLEITLTERELRLPRQAGAPGDDPGVRLRIAYEARYDPLDAFNWLPESRLREIGFSFHVPVGAPQAAEAYDHVPARMAWVAFEYDGPQWREIDRRRALRSDNREPRPPSEAPSRLVPVDAGADFDQLRRRYASGHLILRGVIGLTYVSPENGGPLVHGTLREVVPHTVAVPHEFQTLLRDVRPRPVKGVTEPRYEVDVAVGRLGLPYVRAVRLAR
jgi:hypothetical protein